MSEEIVTMDWSTINQKELSKLPYYKLPSTYRLQKDHGNGCFLDPPGYPTYFTRDIYTRSGNEPGRGPTQLLNHRVVRHNDDWKKYGNWDDLQAAYNSLMRKLWMPLPIQHERVQAWITYVTGYFKNCYVDTRLPEDVRRKSDKLVIGSPISAAKQLGIATPYPETEDIDIGLEQILDRAAEVHQYVYQAIERFDRATDYIHQWYPEYDGSQIGKGTYGKGGPGNWWETCAERPTPENCKPRWGKHPMNGNWCQWCGWSEEEANQCAA